MTETIQERNARWKLRRATEEAERLAELREVRGRKFANFHGYTDVNPFEIVNIVSEKTIEIRAMETEQTKMPSDFHPGGFHGHYADNHGGQEYTYSSNKEFSVKRIRWSERKGTWQCKHGSRYHIADAPYKFYDYNF